jgi:beta-N-acetylhexosaminidase
MSISPELHKAVGLLITGKVAGYEIDARTEQLITNGTMSGVTLFKDNARDLAQLVALVDKLMKLGGPDFLIMVDQEGGAVQRFDHVVTPLPSPMALAERGDPTAVRSVMSVSGQQMRLLGVNCVLAPVLDINSNPRNPIIGTRSFGSDRDRVVEMANAVSEAYIEEGILPVGKHYPGHGDTFEDSHLKLAVVHADREMLEERELYPFRNCARNLPSMLVGHVWLTEFDAEALPASLSPKVTQQLLREEIGYDGFLMTDDMPVMKAIVDHWGLPEAGVMAINAGLDNLLLSGTVEQIESVHQAICEAVESGTITKERLESALRRRKKALSVCRNDRPESLAERERQLQREIQAGNAIAAEVSSRCVRLVRGDVPNPIAAPDEWVLVVPNHPRYKLDVLTHLTSQMRPGAAAIRERRYSLNPLPDEIEEIFTFAHGKKCLFMTFRALLNEGQMELARRLALTNPFGVLVASDVPYELDELPEWKNAIATFDPSDLAMQSLAAFLTRKGEL